MRVAIFGASGSLGKVICKHLERKYEIIKVGYKNGDYNIDASSPESIHNFFKNIGKVDSIISLVGHPTFKSVNTITSDEWITAYKNKVLSQINIAQVGKKYLKKDGSITLTSWGQSDINVIDGALEGVTSCAVEGFVKSASFEFDDIRLNAVGPDICDETKDKYHRNYPENITIPGKDVAELYIKSLEDDHSGIVYTNYDYSTSYLAA